MSLRNFNIGRKIDWFAVGFFIILGICSQLAYYNGKKEGYKQGQIDAINGIIKYKKINKEEYKLIKDFK